MIAARKLYPQAVMVFSGSQEKNLRDFMGTTLLDGYNFTRLKQIDLGSVSTLIVVDTRDSKRIGALATCLDNPGIAIHLYDHHPDRPDDMKGERELVEQVGSTTTLFTQIFQERRILLSPVEATILALGIYEDTGSLTHLSTRPADLRAAAWLLEHGARLDILSQYMRHDTDPLTARQVELLHELMASARTYTVQNLDIVVASLSLPSYVDDFALIVLRFMHMENLAAIFALVSMDGRTSLIARSRIPEVDAGTVARDCGGGGHPSAASATIHDLTLIEAEDKLIRLLHKHIRPRAIAPQMLSQPVISVPVTTSIDDAHNLLTRYNITALPVLAAVLAGDAAPTVVGIITRRVIEKAIHHGLGHLPVGEYMSGDIAILPLSATLSDIEELIIERRQRLIPIVHERQLAGVITRTDLLTLLVGDPAHRPKNMRDAGQLPSQERTRDLKPLIAEILDQNFARLLMAIGEVADSLGFAAFAVGGFVRDLLLQTKNLDLDIVVEGDGIVFAKRLAERLGGQVKAHKRFITAMILLPDWNANESKGLRIDVATARLEYYDYPAALPTVELSSIKLDLYRRDFTINAMAIQLNPAKFGTLIDFFNCQGDLKDKTIRVLHNLSFVEDPTRIFRAIRFEQRMGFKIDAHTNRLIQSAVKMNLFDKSHSKGTLPQGHFLRGACGASPKRTSFGVPPKGTSFGAPPKGTSFGAYDGRFFTELQLIFAEENPLPSINRLAEFKLFSFLWPDLKPNLKIDRRFNHILTQASQALAWFHLLYLDEPAPAWQVYLLAIMGRSKATELSAFCLRFGLAPKIHDFLVQQKNAADKIANFLYRRSSPRHSELYWLLQGVSSVGLLYLMAIARKKEIKQAVSLFVTELSKIKTQLTGDDLQAMGYLPGPGFKAMLAELLTARLDGVVGTRDEEEAYLAGQFPVQGVRSRYKIT